jgi:hypothetical protein
MYRPMNTAIGSSFRPPTFRVNTFALERPHRSKTEFNGRTEAAFRFSPYIDV